MQSLKSPRLAAYLSLTKPRITLFVVMTAFVGFVAGTRGPLRGMDLWLLGNTLLGTALVASGTSAFNQVFEKDLDARMARTAARPLPSGRLGLAGAALFAGALSLAGLAELWATTDPVTTALAAFTLVSYVLVYTPMKTRSPASTIVGAVPGALPPLGGFTAAAGGHVGLPGLALFAILFVWQLPHFFAIGWRHREDYAKAGVVILPVVDPSGRATARQTLLWTAVLLPISLLPSLVGTAGFAYAAGAFAMTLLFLSASMKFARDVTDGRARSLFLASIAWLPAVLLLLVADRV
ncbi:MAG TPA: heme o synthase [Thermoanaerobaculia bacterium]|nr:heme o synthase [Thermoanaerobaculia bacterium]